MLKPIYIDHNATTPCAPEVVEAMAPFFSTECGNPSSSHLLGQRAHVAVTKARETIAGVLGCEARELVFTSGATESNNQILLGCASAAGKRRRIIISPIEHKSVLGPAEQLSNLGFEVHKLEVDGSGTVILESLDELLDESTFLISVQAANSEIGTIQPIRQIAEAAHARGVYVHCDATQLLGKQPLDVYELGVDFASFSAHKMYGPKGVGALFVRQGEPSRIIAPIMWGGAQEASLRAGTLNVPGIVGFAEACHVARKHLSADIPRIAQLRNSLEAILLNKVRGGIINGSISNRLAGTSNVTIPGIQADTLIANTPSVCISGGSACTDGTVSPSHVLLALGLSREEARCTIRFGIGRYNTKSEIDSACAQLISSIQTLRDTPNEPVHAKGVFE